MSAMGSDQAGYYLGLAREDYYLAGGEPPGRWYGSGALELGLAGQVVPDHLYNLFDGLSPNGNRSLIQRQGHDGKAEHRPGWDLTFSAPKSVSVLWSQSETELRAAIQGVHARAVSAALDYLQDTAAFTRRGKGGKDLEKVGLVVATFEHSTSRALDPQLHTHALVMNLSVRDDGSTGTLSSLDLFLSKMAAGALYRAELAKGLQEELGLEVKRERTWFEVAGVSNGLIQTFSKRREAIVSALKTSGLNSAEAAAVAAIQTRDAKGDISRSELFEMWRNEGSRHGWRQQQAEALFGRFYEERDPEKEISRACDRATERLTWDEAFFSERDFVRYLAEESQGQGLGADAVRAGASWYLSHSPDIIKLGVHRGEERFTTETMMGFEKELLSGAEELRKNESQQLHAETVMGILAKQGTQLSEEQLAAVWHVTVETGGLAIVSGMAGTGKTRMLDVARDAWEAEGYRVEGVALAARAAKALSTEAKIESDTIAKILLDIERGKRKLDSKSVLIVDEAGMVATPDMRRLIHICEEAQSKLVLVGDERQLQPIGPGAPFRELGERYDRAELTDIRRQNDDWARQAVKDLADGNARNALFAFAEHGLLWISKTRDEAMHELVAQWRGDGRDVQDTLILAGTKAETKTLNAMVQAERERAGALGETFTEIGGEKLYLNDRVMFTQNKRTLGIENGSKGIICAIGESGSSIGVRLDSGEKVTIQPDAFPHVQLGYASTTHKAQGETTLRAYVLGGGPIQGRELSYVQASRARVQTKLFATATETGDEVIAVAREMERTRQKEMASAVLRQQESGQNAEVRIERTR